MTAAVATATTWVTATTSALLPLASLASAPSLLPSSSVSASVRPFGNGTTAKSTKSDSSAESVRVAPVPIHFRTSEFNIDDPVETDNYGYLLKYPQPFETTIEQLAAVVNTLNQSYNDAGPPQSFGTQASDDGVIKIRTPPALSINLYLPACNVSTVADFSQYQPGGGSGYGAYNCTRACSNSSLLFQPTTMIDCMQLAAAAIYVEAGRAAVNQTDHRTTAAAASLGYPADLHGFNGTRVMQELVTCSVAACKKGRVTCGAEVLALEGISIGPDSLPAIHTVLNGYCDRIDPVTNEDIAGPGVLMSYILQTAIALLFSTLAKILTSVLRPLFWARYKASDETRSQAWKLATARQNRLALTRANAAVISSMVEFQEMQGYFVAAIQVATIVTIRHGGAADLTTVSSFGSLMFNSGLVQVLAVSGTLPVLLVQCSLQRAGMRWWYTFAITMFVFGLGAIVDVAGGYTLPPFRDVWGHFKDQFSIPECGGNPSPLVYCDSDLRLAISDDFGMEISYVVVPTLFFDQLAWWLWRRYALERKVRRWERSHPFARVLRRNVWPIFWFLFWLLLQVILTVFTVIYLYNIIMLVLESTLVNDKKWTYGQLVSVMLWGPILGKYIYFNIFGIEEGFGRRLAKHYRVVHQEESSDEEDDDDDRDDLDGHMEQGIEMKPSPNTSSTSISGVMSPAPSPIIGGGPPSPTSPDIGIVPALPQTNTAPAPGQVPIETPVSTPIETTNAITSIEASRPYQPASTPAPDYFDPYTPPITHGFEPEGVTTAGGVVIAVENHEPTGR